MFLLTDKGAPEAQDADDGVRALRFRVACRLLRLSGMIDKEMPGQRRGESQIDWLVRIGIARDKYAAAEALIAAKGRTRVLDESVREVQLFELAATGSSPQASLDLL